MNRNWKHFAFTGFIALNGLACAPLARAQDHPLASDVERRVELLQQRIEQLERRLDAVLPAETHGRTAGTVDAPRLTAIEQKLQLLERSSSPTTAETGTKDAAVVSAGRDGFFIASVDRAYRLKVGGYAQADGKTFYDDSIHLLTNSFAVRRARLNIDGTVGRFVDFRIAPDFGNGSTTLYDAYADLKYQPWAVLRGGKFKTPLGLELLQNDTELTFIERSLVSSLIPNRDTGFQLSGDIAGRLTYAVAALNGAADGTNIDGDSNDGKDVVARLFATPFASSGASLLKGLGLGAAVSSGRQNGAVLPSLKSTGGQAVFFSYANTATAAGRRLRYSPQLYYYNGPLGFMAEYVESAQEIKGTSLRSISNHAWQMTGSWVLTGERKSYKSVQPRRALEGDRSSGFGAWELAFRYSELNIDPAAFQVKLADITKSAEAARNWAVGVNWYLNRNARLSMDYEQTRFQGGAVAGNRPTEKAFEQRLQVVF